MNKTSHILLLDNIQIGHSELEYGDPSMGCVHGRIHFTTIRSGYTFFKTYCEQNGIELTGDYPQGKLISTRDIPELKVVNNVGRHIKGLATYVEGMDSAEFFINIEGLDSILFKEEFPSHYNRYFGE